jgi:hypothetical protein
MKVRPFDTIYVDVFNGKPESVLLWKHIECYQQEPIDTLDITITSAGTGALIFHGTLADLIERISQ